jgi:hypothetical protein
MTGGAVFELRQTIQAFVLVAYHSNWAVQPTRRKEERLRAPPPLIKQLTPFSAKQVLLV